MSNVETTIAFISTWRSQDPNRLYEELFSLHNETNRKKDCSTFKVTDNGLTDSATGQPVRNFIRRDTRLYQTEYSVFEKLESWAKDTEEGIAVWISPPHSGKYPCAKVTLSMIAYDWQGKKYLQNSTILFGNDNTDCSNIIPGSPIKNPEHIRGTLFQIEDRDEAIFPILSKVKKYAKFVEEGEDRSQEVTAYARRIREGTPAENIVAEMMRSGFLGQHSISCPPSSSRLGFSDYMLKNSIIITDKWEYHKGRCRECGAGNTDVGPCKICKSCEKKYNVTLTSNKQ